MRIQLRYVVAVTVWMLILTGCGVKGGEVRGTFVDREGAPLAEDITVSLVPLATFEDGGVGWSLEYQLSEEYGQRKQELVTGDGAFTFLNVVPGPYWVEAKLEGSPIQTSPAFQVTAGGEVDFGVIKIE